MGVSTKTRKLIYKCCGCGRKREKWIVPKKEYVKKVGRGVDWCLACKSKMR